MPVYVKIKVSIFGRCEMNYNNEKFIKEFKNIMLKIKAQKVLLFAPANMTGMAIARHLMK